MIIVADLLQQQVVLLRLVDFCDACNKITNQISDKMSHMTHTSSSQIKDSASTVGTGTKRSRKTRKDVAPALRPRMLRPFVFHPPQKASCLFICLSVDVQYSTWK
jgi:hypothetical protein